MNKNQNVPFALQGKVSISGLVFVNLILFKTVSALVTFSSSGSNVINADKTTSSTPITLNAIKNVMFLIASSATQKTSLSALNAKLGIFWRKLMALHSVKKIPVKLESQTVCFVTKLGTALNVRQLTLFSIQRVWNASEDVM